MENGLVSREIAGRPSLPQIWLNPAIKGKGVGNKKPRVARFWYRDLRHELGEKDRAVHVEGCF